MQLSQAQQMQQVKRNNVAFFEAEEMLLKKEDIN